MLSLVILRLPGSYGWFIDLSEARKPSLFEEEECPLAYIETQSASFIMPSNSDTFVLITSIVT